MLALPGDMDVEFDVDLDDVDLDDVDAFVLGVVDGEEYRRQFDADPLSGGDLNDDGFQNEQLNDPLELQLASEEIKNNEITVSGQKIHTQFADWLKADGEPIPSDSFAVDDLVHVAGEMHGNAYFAHAVQQAAEPGGDARKVALLFVGHGEPAHAEDGDLPITHADGTPFGPHAVSLGVPPPFQYTEWAAAYEEIATAMTYIFPDLNNNGIPHEMEISPAGDVPPFFNWFAFHASVYDHYAASANYSPHNDALRAHVESLDIAVSGADIDVYLAYLDAAPRIRDVVWDITAVGGYDELVVVPMLLSKSTHTDEIEELVEETADLIGDMDVLVTEPFFEVPFARRRFKEAVLAMAAYVESAIPPDVEDHNIGVVLASHGSPYVPPVPEYGWVEGEIYSYLVPTEDAFHAEIAEELPWMSRTGRMNYSSPTIEDALVDFEDDGFTHIVVVPSAFPTPAIHTMWDVANAAVERAVLPEEGVVMHTRPSGMNVYYSSEGIADFGPGQAAFRRGLEFMGTVGVMEALEEDDTEGGGTPHVACHPDELCITVAADAITGDELKFMFYETTEDDWPETIADLPIPNWVVTVPPPMPDRFPARIRIPLESNLLAVAGGTLEGARLGLVVASSTGPGVAPTDARGFSASTLVYEPGNPMNYGTVHLAVPTADEPCLPGEICVTVTGGDVTGPDLKLMLYEATEDNWPQDFASIPTPGWVVTETVPVPASFPVDIRIPVESNLFAISTEPIEGKRVGLAVVTGVASTFIVEPTDARGFSAGTMSFDALSAMDFGDLELAVPAGEPCDLNPYHPSCLTGPMFWQERFLEDTDFVPGAIYMDVADIDEDGVDDIIMVGEPHFEFPELPLTVLKLGVYYMNGDGSVRETEIVDQWTETDQLFYSPWGVRVIMHGGSPMMIVGTNIPELAPLEEGTGAILSYHRDGGTWVRSIVRQNPDPTGTNYNSMIVVPADIDNDGDDDLALSGAFGSSSVGSWMENTGDSGTPWIPHLQPMAPGTDPAIRGTLAYKSADLNGDGYPEVVYNAMFDIPGTVPPRYRGEIWLAVNPGPTGWDDPWQMIVIDDDNWASADMWFHDLNEDGYLDLVANQIFSSTVTLYHHPGSNLGDPWVPEIIISGLTSPSDMWLADMDKDGLMDVVSADHTAHRGVWHKNPGARSGELWEPYMIYRNIRLPGDFAMADVDDDGDLDWIGTSLTLGQAFIVEQVEPPSSLVLTVSLPAGFAGQVSKLLVSLANEIPVTGIPVAIPVTIDNVDSDGDGQGDVDQILNPSHDLVLAVEDVGITGDYHVVITLYMEGGGVFQPVPGIDYMASSPKLTFGAGTAEAGLELQLVPSMANPADFDRDGLINCADVDSLVTEILAGTNTPAFDLKADGNVDTEDLTEWLAQAASENLPSQAPYPHGDANLDGKVDARDLNLVGESWRQNVTGWCRGDFTADGVVDPRDLNLLALNWREDVLGEGTASHERVPRAPLANAVALPSDDSGVLRGTTGLRLLRARADHVDVATSEFVRPRVAPTRYRFHTGGVAAMRFHPPPYEALPDSVQERLVDLALRQLRLA